MQPEIEVKFNPVDVSQIREKLKSIGAKLQQPERPMRRVVFLREDNPSMKPACIRVRDENDAVVRLSAKEYSREIAEQMEADVTVSDFDTTVEILELAGLKKSAYQETRRETWAHHKAVIEIDWWPWLEPTLEIEAEDEASVRTVAQALELDWDRKFVGSYGDLYMKIYGIDLVQMHQKTSNLKFEKNPFI